MTKAIIITSIFEPTEAVKKFAQLQGYQLIVVGDRKTPKAWQCERVIYLAVDDQQTNHYELNKILPYNHYCRKMLGYLFAIEKGAIMIVDTDDDNIPKENWGFPGFEGLFPGTEPDLGFINVYKFFTEQHIWPRGLPLGLINSKQEQPALQKAVAKIDIWQGLADEDPDVDALYRLTCDKPCYFDNKEPLFLSAGTLAPFNTQNTLIRKELYPLLYLPVSVTFRFTDILRGLVAQPIMWLNGYCLGFTNATVIQKRNPHNYYDDFISELPMYEHCENIITLVKGVISPNETIAGNLYSAYVALTKHHIVADSEIPALKAWLKDISDLEI
ncbi:MAG TPA: STELLO glycosyltransferase family protein [Mucilaginibacter sp.]|jgi:hypothetical protein